MNTDSTSATSLSFSKRLPSFASIALLAATIFGLARLGFGVVPVWILAVPFILLASMDFEERFRQTRSVTGQVGMIAFHFVIIATVVAAHQQIGGTKRVEAVGTLARSATFSKGAGGCGSGGCGAGGNCGSTCGSGHGMTAAGTGGKSACGCGTGGSASVKAAVATAPREPVAGPLARSTLIDADGAPKHVPAPAAGSSTSRSPVFISSRPPGVTAGGLPLTAGPTSTVTANPTSTAPSPTTRVPGVTNVPLPGLIPHAPPSAPSSGPTPATPPAQAPLPPIAAESTRSTPSVASPAAKP